MKKITFTMLLLVIASSLIFTGCPEPSSGELPFWMQQPINTNRSSVPLRAVVIAPPGDPTMVLVIDSWTDGTHNYYKIDGGVIDNILISVMQEIYYNGITPMTSTSTITTGTSITESIREIATSSYKHEQLHEAKASTSIGIGPWKASASWTGSWKRTTYDERSTETSTTKAISFAEARSVSFTIGNNGETAGWYRYSLYAKADMIFYVKTSRDNKELIEWDSAICVRNDSHFPYFEYSANYSFNNTPENKLTFPEDFWKNMDLPDTDYSSEFYNKISTGEYHSLAIDRKGKLWVWGRNGHGRLGDGTTTNRNRPVEITPDRTYSIVSAGMSSSYAIDTDGNLWAWGRNDQGQLGDGTTTHRSVPVGIRQDKKFIAISAGTATSFSILSSETWASHCLAIDTDGYLWAWGANTYGQLGDGTIMTVRTSPVQIKSDTRFKAVSAGPGHSLAIDTDGNLWAWGRNNTGQLGDGTRTDRYNPVLIKPDSKFNVISAGGFYDGTIRTGTFTSIRDSRSHSLAIDENGNLWAWGDNSYGQLGNGNRTSQTSPVQITIPDARFIPGTKFKVISAGAHNSMAIDANNNLWVWGRNNRGQLGTQNNTDYTSPRLTEKPDLFFYFVSASEHSLAIDNNRRLWVWGYNADGQLGLGSTASMNILTRIDNFYF